MAKLSLSFKGHPIAVHHFNSGSETTTIGRDPSCALVIDSLAVAPFHAKISCDPAGCKVSSLTDEAPTLLNHQPVTEHLLIHGDIIQIGKHILSFAEDAQIFDTRPHHQSIPIKARILKLPPITPKPAKQENAHKTPIPNGISEEDFAAIERQSQLKIYVQIVNGRHFGKVIPIESGLTRLSVEGREAAVIAHRRDGYFLAHLEGNQPPCINTHSIEEHSQQLFDGDNIQIGNIRMIFHHQSSAIPSQIAADA